MISKRNFDQTAVINKENKKDCRDAQEKKIIHSYYTSYSSRTCSS